MNCIKVLKWTLLVTCIVILTSCMNDSNETSDQPQEKELTKMPKIIFLYEFEIRDQKNRNSISYLDEDGNIYSKKMPIENRNLRLLDLYEEIELLNDDIKGNVEKEKVKAMYDLFLQVPTESGELDNLLYFELNDDAVIGWESWYGFRYNQKGELEVIPLNDEGESGYKNQNETAQEIGQWLKSVLHEYQYYEQ